MAIVIGLLIALPVGIYSAIRQDTAADYLGRSIAIIGMATPNFWPALMVMLYPALWWGWSPPLELVPFTEDPLGNLGVFIIPSVILGTAMAAATVRMTRTMMLEVLRQDYIRTAWSKGLKERVVIMRHAIKNALIPVVTLIGLQLPLLVGGSVIMENIFALPGLGRLMVNALQDRDYPVVSGVNLFFCNRSCGDQSNDRPDLSVLRPQGPIQLKGEYERRHRDTISRKLRQRDVPGWLIFFIRLVREKPLGTACGIIVLILILVAIFADVLAPYGFLELHLADRLQGSSARYLLGTDHLGRDFLSALSTGLVFR